MQIIAKDTKKCYYVSMKYISNSVQDTNKCAEMLAQRMNGGEIILLNGDLGAGKTTFTKAFAKALGVEGNVTSPTFTFMREYNGKFPIYHFDMYRVSSEDELYELGLNDYLESDTGICLIEWNKFEDIAKPIININITRTGNDSRIIEIEGIE